MNTLRNRRLRQTRMRRSRGWILLCALWFAGFDSAASQPRSFFELDPPYTWAANSSLADELLSTCIHIANRLASVSYDECKGSGLTVSGTVSVLGTPILVGDYPADTTAGKLGNVLLFGGIHGDEYSSISIVFKWLAEMAGNEATQRFHWRVAPLLNPDGLLRPVVQRMNHNGVDLNRNFPIPDWQQEAQDYWIRRTSRNPRRYPGSAPLSEPESRWLAHEIERFNPSVIVSIHAPIHLLDFDGPLEPPAKLGPLYLRRMGTYPGSLGRYAGVYKKIPVVTIELPNAGKMPSPAEQRRIWTDLLAWLEKKLPAELEQRGPTPTSVSLSAN